MDHRFEEFNKSILLLNRYIQRIKNIEMKEFNLKSVHVMCLFILNEYNSLSQVELLNKSQEDKGQVSRAVNDLIKLGYITDDQSDKAKKYNAKLSLTKSGKVIADKVTSKINKALDFVDDSLTEDERKAFYEALFKISSKLECYTNELDE